MKDQLEKVNAKVLGVVLNKVDKIDYRSYYNGYDYYGNKKKYVKGWLENFRKR
jgi:protein-tyrosine kinase